MDHLFNISVFHAPEEIAAVVNFRGGLSAMGADGLELQTGYSPAPADLSPSVTSVHLPYAVDWFGPWTGRRSPGQGLEGDWLRYRCYGHDRDSIIDSLRLAIRCAEPVEPVFGVMHAGCGNIEEILCTEYTDDPGEVINAFCEMVNEAVSSFPGGEPPFTLAFENTWWPGFRALDGECFRVMERELAFDDWGLCIDTGHMLVSAGGAGGEAEALSKLNACVDRYPQSMIDRVVSMHLHTGAGGSARHAESMTREQAMALPEEERVNRAFSYLGHVDPHHPFTSGEVTHLVERLSPDCIVHEMSALRIEDHIRDHICQRSLFGGVDKL